MNTKKKKSYVKTEVVFHPANRKEMSIKKFLGNLPIGSKTRIIIKALLFYASYADLTDEKDEFNVSFYPLKRLAKSIPDEVPKLKDGNAVTFDEKVISDEIAEIEDKTEPPSPLTNETISVKQQEDDTETKEKPSQSTTVTKSSAGFTKKSVVPTVKPKQQVRKPKKPKTPSLADYDDTEEAFGPSKEDMLDEMLNDLNNFN